MSTPTGGYYPQEPYYAPGWSAPNEPPRPRRGRRWLVVVAIALPVVLLASWGITALATSLRSRPVGEVTEPRTALARQLDVGHCLETLPDDGDVQQVRLVPCADAHEAEVVGVHTFRADEWPGQEAVDAEASGACEMDAAQLDAGFRAVVWSPSEAGWGQGDRRGLCLAWLPEGAAQGSFTAGDEVTTG